MRGALTLLLGLGSSLLMPGIASGGCGCAKPPPARAVVRPFVAYQDQSITLFDDRFVPGTRYQVQFTAMDGTTDWSRGRAVAKRDLADATVRHQLRVKVAAVPLGPCAITVWDKDAPMLRLGDSDFTVAAAPVMLHDFTELVRRNDYQAAVGRDGTVFIPLDVWAVDAATTFVGAAQGFALKFAPTDVAIYNEQGFLMQLLDPKVTDLFRITAGDTAGSNTFTYWRHEFATYKQAHRTLDAWENADDTDWHADGSYHVDHDHLVIAIRGILPNGSAPAPGATRPFRLAVTSTPSDRL